MSVKKPKHIALLTGFSGAGKTTLWKELLALHPEELKRVITYTTRPPRDGEVHGVDYHFLAPDEFLHRKSQGHFLEASEHYGHHYGSPNPEHVDLEEHQIPIYTVDTNGSIAIKEHYPETHAFFLYISPEEQYRRLTERNADPENVKKRLERYHHEQEILERNRHLYHIIRNEEPDDLHNAIQHFRKTLQLG